MGAQRDFSEKGVFAAPVIKPSLVNDKIAVITGARLGISFNRFIIGLGAYSQNLIKQETEVPDERIAKAPYLEFAYFGLESEYIFLKYNKTYFSGYLFAGIGYTTLSTRLRVDVNNESYNPAYGDDLFYIIEPAVNYNYMVNSWLNICAGISYRKSLNANYIPNNVETQFDDKTFSGFGSHFTVKLGIF